MEVGDGPRQLGHEPGGLARVRPVLVGELLQVQAPDMLHDHERPALVDAEVDDPDQVGMVALRQEPPLADHRLVPGAVRPRRRRPARSATGPA